MNPRITTHLYCLISVTYMSSAEAEIISQIWLLTHVGNTVSSVTGMGQTLVIQSTIKAALQILNN